MAISGIGATVRFDASLTPQAATRRTDARASAESDQAQGASAAKTTGTGAPSGAGGPPAGGAQKSSAAGGSSSASQSTIYDKKDANKDGVVSALEELTYDLRHPAAQTGTILDLLS